MKNDRQTAVLQIIEETAVETQEQLMQLLAVRGFACTQATVSRDIKQLHLMKAPDGKGGYRYAVSAQMPKLNFEEKLQTIFRECVVSAENAQNLAIIKTMNGMANAAAFALDSMKDTDIVGTLAGDDTVLLYFTTVPTRRISANRCGKCCAEEGRSVCWSCCILRISLLSRRRISNSHRGSMP